ncbi:MAG: DUF2442 domain-containing protein [Candidatus Methylumidiphilus sp.]
MLHIIERVQPNPINYTVVITYCGKQIIQADFKPMIEQGGIMTPFRDPSAFATVRVGARGRSLVWGEDVEFCADGLWEKFVQMGQAAA